MEHMSHSLFMLQAEAAQLKDKLQAEAAQLKDKLQAAHEQNEQLLAAQQAAEQQLAAQKASAVQKPSPARTPSAVTAAAAAAGGSDEGPEHIQHGYSKDEQEHSPADRANDAVCAAGTGAAVGNDEAAEEAAGDGTDGFDFGADDLPVTQSEAWAAAGAIAATQADCDTEDTEQPAMSQPAKLSTAARLQRSKHAQQKQRSQEGHTAATAVSSRQHTQATGKSPDLQQPGGSTAGTTQMAFKTPYPPVEPEPHTKKGPTTGTTAAAAVAG